LLGEANYITATEVGNTRFLLLQAACDLKHRRCHWQFVFDLHVYEVFQQVHIVVSSNVADTDCTVLVEAGAVKREPQILRDMAARKLQKVELPGCYAIPSDPYLKLIGE
jgi:hypothetical protein